MCTLVGDTKEVCQYSEQRTSPTETGPWCSQEIWFFSFHVSVCIWSYTYMYTCVGACVCRCLWRLEVDVRSLPQFLFHLIHWSRISPSNPEVAINLVSLASLLWVVISSGPTRSPDSRGFQRSELQCLFFCRKCFNLQTSWFLSVRTMLVSRRQVLTFWS